MCGRYTITVTIEELMARFMAEDATVPFHRPRYNVAPMQLVPAVIHDGTRNRLGMLRNGGSYRRGRRTNGSGRA